MPINERGEFVRERSVGGDGVAFCDTATVSPLAAETQFLILVRFRLRRRRRHRASGSGRALVLEEQSSSADANTESRALRGEAESGGQGDRGGHAAEPDPGMAAA